MTAFDPATDRIVAVSPDGQHKHVDLAALDRLLESQGAVTEERIAALERNVVLDDARTARDLSTVKTEAKHRVSGAGEAARQRYITPGSGKAMSYRETADEAKRYVATSGAGSYPFLQARVASGRYRDLASAATGTLTMEAQWAAVGAAIDEAEDRAKLAIDAATTVDEVRAAEQVDWP